MNGIQGMDNAHITVWFSNNKIPLISIPESIISLSIDHINSTGNRLDKSTVEYFLVCRLPFCKLKLCNILRNDIKRCHFTVQVINADMHELPAGQMGDIVVKLPLPPGCMLTLWKADNRFVESYMKEFPGYYQTSDAGFIDEDGYINIMSRTDDIINVAGHRLSTGGIEGALCEHPDVAESAVIGVHDDLKGQVPLGFLVLKNDVETPHNLIIKHVIEYVRENIGPVASFKSAIIVDRLPKTRSGKILRGTMRKIANGEEYTVPATIDDPMILEEITTVLQTIGYAQQKPNPAAAKSK